MKQIAIFIHLYQFGDWKNIYTDQITKLQESGLLDAASFVFLGVNGSEDLPIKNDKIRVFRNDIYGIESAETYTLKALYDYSFLKDDVNVLYLHAKGVTWSNSETFDHSVNTDIGVFTKKQIYDNTQHWRNYLEFFLIKNWQICVDLLNSHDVVGTELNQNSYFGGFGICKKQHYGGNMWWSNTEYIKKLDVNFVINNLMIGRYAHELWICTKNPKTYCFYNSNTNPYTTTILEDHYKHTIENFKI